MKTNEIIKTIKDLLEKSRGSLIKNLIYGKYPDLAEFIKNKTSFMDAYAEKYGYKYTWLERIYCVINNVCDFPQCKALNCSNKLYKPSSFLGLKFGFRPYCSLSCATHSPDVLQHRKENCMEKYGVSNASKIDSVIRKMLSTRDERGSMKHAVEKARMTRFSKNGGKWHADDFGDKVKSGKIANGHDPNWNNIEKRKETLRREHDVNSTFELPHARKASADAIRRKSFRLHIENCPYDTPEFTLEDYLARKDDSEQLVFKCRKCGNVFRSAHHDGKHRRCPKCWPKLDGVSNSELDLREVVMSYAGGPQHVVFSDRTVIHPLELDVYVPSKNLAIEFDGLYWHCDANERITKTYHLEKTNACARKGIRLIHVFEDEWKDKRHIVESRLKNAFGLYDKIIFARKCQIAEVSARESNSFQDETHLQGHVNASVRLGLYFENELVSLMTFGKCRFDKKHEWELLRFCCKLGYHVPGAASRLLKYFEKNWKPKSLVTYADRRWSEGNLYNKLGFDFVRNSPPNYWYVGNDICRHSRIEFQKHKLKDKLKIYDSNKTEIENMRMNGFYRIFDCGNMVFEKEYSNEGM